MATKIVKVNKLKDNSDLVIIIDKINELPKDILNAREKNYVAEVHKNQKKHLININRLQYAVYVYIVKKSSDKYLSIENCRKAGNTLVAELNKKKVNSIIIYDHCKLSEYSLAFAEGMFLGNYQFVKYKTGDNKKENTVNKIEIFSDKITTQQIITLNIINMAVCCCRDLVNEPVSTMNSEKFAGEIVKLSNLADIKTEVFGKKKIESLKMGGLLGVNRGSIDPPFFVIQEYKPKEYINKKPYVLVGKGIVFDTGGMNLKPGNSMETMKCDMSGAAAVATALYAVATKKLPLWIITLIPVTDNRPSGNAHVPGDIITMSDGTTVEVLNTDAEGRLILADALVYAGKYKPQLVIDIATLTGSAHAAIGRYGIVGMQSKSSKEFEKLLESGNRVMERIVEFPLWDDYKELIKSEVADLKNIGGRYAGAITAGKFLQHFTDYPYIHLDIAGPAFNESRDSYKGTGGSGVCVRLLFDFFLRKTLK